MRWTQWFSGPNQAVTLARFSALKLKRKRRIASWKPEVRSRGRRGENEGCNAGAGEAAGVNNAARGHSGCVMPNKLAKWAGTPVVRGCSLCWSTCNCRCRIPADREGAVIVGARKPNQLHLCKEDRTGEELPDESHATMLANTLVGGDVPV